MRPSTPLSALPSASLTRAPGRTSALTSYTHTLRQLRLFGIHRVCSFLVLFGRCETNMGRRYVRPTAMSKMAMRKTKTPCSLNDGTSLRRSLRASSSCRETRAAWQHGEEMVCGRRLALAQLRGDVDVSLSYCMGMRRASGLNFNIHCKHLCSRITSVSIVD